MATQIKQTLQYYYSYSKKPILIFWLSFFSFLLLSLLLSIHDSVTFQFYGITSIISMIFLIFYPILTFKNVFPFVIKMGVNRKSFTIGTFIYGLVLSTLLVLVNYIYLYLFNFLADFFSINGYLFIGMNMPEYTEEVFGNIYLFDWLLHVSLFLLFTFIGAFFYRFGATYGFLLIGAFTFSLFIRAVAIKFFEIFNYLLVFDESYAPGIYLIIITICLMLNWLIIHRSSIIDQITKQR